jgi:broad specificity phosphatase PhoE
MDIVLIRHPAVALDAGVCYGHSDVALAEDAEISASALALKLATLQVPPPRVDVEPADTLRDAGCGHGERFRLCAQP